MAFVPVPKDLNRVKTKVMFNLTKRQLIRLCTVVPVFTRVLMIVSSCDRIA